MKYPTLVLGVLLVGACSTPQPSGLPDAPKGVIDADAVLQRHLDVSQQCKILTSTNYTFVWESLTTDKTNAAWQENVRQQGTQGTSFVRLHEQIQPTKRFTAFGLDPKDGWWSGSYAGVRKDLPEALHRPLTMHLDPTPACAFTARWKDRTYVGETDYRGSLAHHVKATWQDDTVTDLYFDVDTGLLQGASTAAEGIENSVRMRKYAPFQGVQWPTEVVSKRFEGGTELLVAEQLKSLTLDDENYKNIGPDEVAVAIMLEVERVRKEAPELLENLPAGALPERERPKAPDAPKAEEVPSE